MNISFEKRLAELDAYLQMLIEESETLDKKLNSTINELERESLLSIKNNLESLIGSIKHSIVLLQIAKVSIKTTASDITSSPFQNIVDRKLSGENDTNLALSRSQSVVDNQEYSPRVPARTGKRQQRQAQPSSATPTSLSLTPKPRNELQSPQTPQEQEPQLTPTHKLASQTQQISDINSAYHQSSQTGEERLYLKAQQIQADSTTIDKFHLTNPGAAEKILKDGATICPTELDEDDDDAFYDAADEQHNQQQQSDIAPKTPNPSPQLNRILGSMNNNNNNIVTDDLIMSNNNNNNLRAVQDGSIDWDELYEEEEEDLGSLENQGSVIKHLMSQIRIGMDLTKVVLPTFILERRSLLEMYADFFAHPDLFSAIPDYETPEERMIQIVRWYLSAFHAGRKSSVAKKPYNPILGEIFLCHWNLDKEANSNSDKTTSISPSLNQDESPIIKNELERTTSTESTDIEKFSKQLPENSLLFVAEQVSHHPPVSAFYAENRDKQISCSAHIYTKSKYLGLSVGVHNIGEGVINIIKHNETYVCTFPSAYGRSILTVPWVELGGAINITCEQTGYSANIEFVTKPFYGGKKHRVLGEILRPNKEPILTIDGEWNGCMYFKSPPTSNNKQVFVDTTCLPVIKKQVRSISSQESFESRNVWKEVTRALKLHDVNGATAAKSFIEQRQRDLLKERLEKGIKWRTRYFEAADEGWRYAKPLACRSTTS